MTAENLFKEHKQIFISVKENGILKKQFAQN